MTRHQPTIRKPLLQAPQRSKFIAGVEVSLARPGLERSKIVFDSGVTLIELIITVTIISILATAAIPIARFQVKRAKERELRADLWMMRDAIDHYKDAADKGGIQTKADSFNYPPDLETLVDGVDVQTKKSQTSCARSRPTP